METMKPIYFVALILFLFYVRMECIHSYKISYYEARLERIGVDICDVKNFKFFDILK